MQAPFQLTKIGNYIMIACGKIEEVEVIPPYKIVVVRTCILKFLHSDPPVGIRQGFKLVRLDTKM